MSKVISTTFSTSGDSLVVPPYGAGWGIRVVGLSLTSEVGNTVEFRSGGQTIAGPYVIAPAGWIGVPQNYEGLFRTRAGEGLEINLSSDNEVVLTLSYLEEPYTLFFNAPIVVDPQQELEPLSIPDLFTFAARGVWWDVQDLSTLWADTAGTTPAVVGGLVARHDDKSGNGWHRTQATEANRPTLRQDATGKYYLDYAGGKTLTVPNSTGEFTWMHDGSGCTVAAFGNFPNDTVSRQWLTSHPNTANQIGWRWMRFSPTTQPWQVHINRGVDADRTATTSVQRLSMSGVPRMFFHTYEETAGLSLAADRTLDRTNTPTANTPSTSGNTGPLGNHSLFHGIEYEVVMVDRVLDETEAQRLYQHMRQNNLNIPSTFDYTFLLGGQSNMVGVGSLTDTLPEDALAGCYSWTRAEEFQLTSAPEHSVLNRPIATDPDHSTPAAPQHGFALQVQKILKTDHDLNTVIVPCAIGSTSIQQWNTPGTLEDRTTLIGAMKYRYGQASLRDGKPVIIYSGHENNALNAVPDFENGGVGSTYQNNLIGLFNTIRNEVVGDPETPIIFVQLGSSFNESFSLGYAAGAEAQRQVELTLPNTYMVVAMDVERNPSPDDIHVSRAGNTVLAQRISKAFEQHVLGLPVNGTGPRIQSASYSNDTVTLTLTRDIEESSTDYGNLFRVYSGGDEVTVSSAARGANNQVVITCATTLTGPVTLTYGYRVGPDAAARTDIVKDSDGLPLPTFGPILVEGV